MATVKDKLTGEEHEVGAEEAGRLVQSGRFLVSDDSEVLMTDNVGRTVSVVGSQGIESVLSQGGAYGDPQSLRFQKFQDEFGGAGQTAIAAGEGVLRGVTLGFSDPLLAGTGITTEENILARQEASPGVAVAGEIVGAVAPALLTGGTGAVATAARLTPAGRAAMVGTGAARAVGGGAARRLAAAGAIEGAAFSAGNEASRQLLLDEELSGERIFGAAIEGAGIGALAGGALGLGGAAIKGITTKVADEVAERLPQLTSKIEEKIVKEIAEGGVGSIDDNLLKRATKASSLDSPTEFLKTVSRELDEGLGVASNLVSKPTREVLEETAAKSQQVLQQVDDELAGSIINKIDNETNATVNLGNLVKKLNEAGASDSLSLAKKLDAIGDTQHTTFGQFKSLVDDVGEEAFVGKTLPDGSFTGPNANLQKAATMFEKEFADRLREVTSKELQPLAQSASELLDRRARLMWIRDNSTKAIESARPGGAKAFALDVIDEAKKDVISLKSLKRAATVAGAAAIGDVSAIGGFALGLLSDAGSNILGRVVKEIAGRTVGPTATETAKKLVKISSASEGLSKAIQTSIKDFFETTGKKASQATRLSAVVGLKPDASRTEKFNAALESLNQAEANLQAVQIKTVQNTIGEDFAQEAPGIAASTAQASARAVQFLRSKAPEVQPPRSTEFLSKIDEKKNRQKVSDREMNKFLRYVGAVTNPQGTIKKFADRTITPQEAEALREVYPRLFAEVKTGIQEQLLKSSTKPDHNDLIALSVLLGEPMHPSMEANFMARVQAQFATKDQRLEEDKKAILAPSRRKAPSISDDMELDERLA